MITQCPHCQQQFRLTDEQIENSQGMVRCGHCMKAFDLELSKTYSASLDSSEVPLMNSDGEQLLSETHLRNFVATGNSRSAFQSGPEEDKKTAGSMETSIDLHSGDRIEPKLDSGDLQANGRDPFDLAGYGKDSCQQNQYRQGDLGTWLVYCAGIPACALLLLGILLQLDLLAPQYTRSKILDPVCSVLKCSHNENSFSIQFSDLRPHPSQKNALIMESVIKNNSSEERRYPALHLKLINAGTRTSAQRTFTRNEYAPGVDAPEKISAGQSIPVTLEIIDPATPINGYQLFVQDSHNNSTTK